MFSDIPSQLRLVLRYIFRMGSKPQEVTPRLIEIPPKDGTSLISVDYWYEIAVRSYLDSEASRQCKVIEIRRYKKKKGSQHEYLVAVLECENKDHRYVRIERNLKNVDEHGVPILADIQKLSNKNDSNETSSVSEENIAQLDISPGTWTTWTPPVQEDAPEDPQPSPKPGNTRGSSFSTSISKSGGAHDIVMYWEPSFEDASVTRIEAFTLTTPIPLVYLAVLAKVVHERESLYNLFKHQCFWYANMIARVVAKQDGIMMKPGGSTSSDQEHCYDIASGKYKMIPVHFVRPRVVDAIAVTYKEECEDLSKTLSASLKSEENKDMKIKKLQQELEELRAHQHSEGQRA